MRDHQEDMNMDQFKLLAEYVLTLDPVITRNMVSNANNFLFKQKMEQLKQPIMPTTTVPATKTKTSTINTIKEPQANAIQP